MKDNQQSEYEGMKTTGSIKNTRDLDVNRKNTINTLFSSIGNKSIHENCKKIKINIIL